MKPQRNGHKRRYEVYRDGILHMNLSTSTLDVQSTLTALSNQDPTAQWEIKGYERRSSVDRRDLSR